MASSPHQVHPHYKIFILSSPPTFRSFFATNNLITQWIKEQRTISICESIWLGVNLIKLNQCWGELGRGELAMGRNGQLPASRPVSWSICQSGSRSVSQSVSQSRRGSRGGEMGEFSPPLFLNHADAQTSNTSTRLWFYYIITKIHPPFQNPGSAPAVSQWCIKFADCTILN